MLWPSPDLWPLRYYYCDVSGSNWFDLSQLSWPELVRSTYTEVSSPRAPRRRQRNQPACCGGAAFLFHNKTWTIIPTLGSLRVYVHPWSGTVSFRFLPCSRYPNSRKFDQKCYAYTQDYPSSRKLRGDYFTTTDDRP
ncbi:hypothetical protein HRI_005291300 [Hibiscus trionum]|uniref:Uncharacterized protein n=1 Tax=Hibiscus trionum TaxID=183268 RepID=A0A9W7JIG2_HIBTR|nr:hypothetical protein HRI_005290100 [Hibiscus trionum]GMJ16221.1 hypothetical protein HRI_005291300 [Hibiscus trionum]